MSNAASRSWRSAAVPSATRLASSRPCTSAGIPFIQVPTTLVAQVDSSIGGKTGVDLPEGKNLVGAFHQPAAIVTDIGLLATLPQRERRAALGEAVKMAALGDEHLFQLLEVRGPALAGGDPSTLEDGSLAELVERCAWAKVEVVAADEKEAAVRIALNLGHSLGHAYEAAGGYHDLRHGEAVAFGLRAACRIGVGGWRDAAGTGGAGGAPPRRPGPGRRPAALRARRGPRAPRRGQEAPLRPAPLGLADGERPHRPRRHPGRAGPRRRRGTARPDDRGERGVTRVLVLQGPNLNLLGTREPEIYGHETLEEIHAGLAAYAAELGLEIDFFQSNHEGALIDRLHQRDFDVAIVNAGGLTHTSVSLRDALLGVERPFIEVHLSDPSTREAFRHVNFLEDIALTSIVGQGARGYHLALDRIAADELAAGQRGDHAEG